MYINNKILVGKNDKKECYLLPEKANRHGLITGASGSGKTITLKVLAESFSDCGVPVFLVDIKGDLAGMCLNGTPNPNIDSRVENLKLENFNLKKYPTTFWDVYEKYGHPIRTTVDKVGSKLLSRMLNLSDAQEGVLAIAFKIAEDEQMELIDLNDLKALLTYVGDKRKEYSLQYGNITTQSVGTIQRSILTLEEEGGDYFFGKPDFDINDFIRTSFDTNQGFINILHGNELFQKPNLYASFLLWLLNTLYNTMPEVGDLDKPKLAFFIDEAHLLFSEMPDHLVKQVIQIVKLIRSKGIGLYFISQTPSDIPDEILSQLGNRIQHVLRAYTKSDEKTVKAAADSFRENPEFNTEEELKQLATGEALVSFQDENGEPTIVEKVTILPPQSAMGAIDDEIRKQVVSQSPLYYKYGQKIDEESADEKIEAINNEKLKQQEEELKKKEEEKLAAEKDKQEEKEKKEKETQEEKKKKKIEKHVDRLASSALSRIGRKIGDAIFKGIFK